MTILEATTKIIEYLRRTNKPYVVIEKDFLDIVTISVDESDKAALSLALKDMVESNMMKVEKVGENEFYVLTRGLDSLIQSVDLSPSTSIEISKIISKFCNVIDDYKDECDPMNLNEKDIFNLTVICNFLLDAPAPNQGGAKGE